MKFLVFADLHHDPDIYDGGTYEDLAFFEKRAKEEGCEFVIHAGDFCHGPTCSDNAEYLKAYASFEMPTYHCIGNHDADRSTFEEVVKAYGMENEYYSFDKSGVRFIVLNPNYYLEDGKYVNFSMSNYYGKSRDHVPPEQLEWLEKTIRESEYPCVLISHQSFERSSGVKNRQAVLDIIDRANAEKKHSVILCINGHEHKDYIRILNGVCYWDLNSASYEPLNERRDHYPKELCEKIVNLNGTLVINDPICAVVTIENTTIDVKGMKSSFFMGITRDMIEGEPVYDQDGRAATAEIQDFHITL